MIQSYVMRQRDRGDREPAHPTGPGANSGSSPSAELLPKLLPAPWPTIFEQHICAGQRWSRLRGAQDIPHHRDLRKRRTGHRREGPTRRSRLGRL